MSVLVSVLLQCLIELFELVELIDVCLLGALFSAWISPAVFTVSQSVGGVTTSLFVPNCPYLSLFVHICPHLSLFVSISPHLSLFVPIFMSPAKFCCQGKNRDIANYTSHMGLDIQKWPKIQF